MIITFLGTLKSASKQRAEYDITRGVGASLGPLLPKPGLDCHSNDSWKLHLSDKAGAETFLRPNFGPHDRIPF